MSRRPSPSILLAGLAALSVALAGCNRGGSADHRAATPGTARPGPAPVAPERAGVDLTASATLSDGVLTVAIRLKRDPATRPQPITLSVDVYALERPSHPDRHFGFWNVELEEAVAAESASWTIDLRTREGRLSLDGKAVTAETAGVRSGGWKGPAFDGALKGFVAAWRTADPDRRQVLDLFTVERLGNDFPGFQPFEVKGSF